MEIPVIGDDPEGFSLAGSFELEVTVADELSSDTVSLELDTGHRMYGSNMEFRAFRRIAFSQCFRYGSSCGKRQCT